MHTALWRRRARCCEEVGASKVQRPSRYSHSTRCKKKQVSNWSHVPFPMPPGCFVSFALCASVLLLHVATIIRMWVFDILLNFNWGCPALSTSINHRPPGAERATGPQRPRPLLGPSKPLVAPGDLTAVPERLGPVCCSKRTKKPGVMDSLWTICINFYQFAMASCEHVDINTWERLCQWLPQPLLFSVLRISQEPDQQGTEDLQLSAAGGIPGGPLLNIRKRKD